MVDVSVCSKEKTCDVIFAGSWHKVQEQFCGGGGNLEVKKARNSVGLEGCWREAMSAMTFRSPLM